METPSHPLGHYPPTKQRNPLTQLARDELANSTARIGTQPIALAAAILIALLAGVALIAGWRAFTGNSPELDRAVAARQLQARATQASEQLVEKAKGLEATQQESIDQLQVVQDQLQTVRRLLAGQQTDTKRLSEQVSALTEAIEGLRQSFASVQTSDPEPSGVRTRSIRHAVGHHRRGRSHS